MSKLRSAKLITSGFIAGALFFGGVSYAATNVSKIEAIFGVKLIQNGIDKTPTDKKPFIVGGTTYVPLRAAAELLDVPITWDGIQSSVIIGEKVTGVPLGAPNKLTAETDNVEATLKSNQPMMVGGKSFGSTGFTLSSKHHNDYLGDNAVVLSYNLDNKYNNLSLAVGYDDKSMNNDAIRNVRFIDQDGKILHGLVLGNGTIHEMVKIDVTGVLELKIEIDGDSSGYAAATVDFIAPVLN